MIQLRVLTGRKAGTTVVTRSFPFSIGRSSQSSLVLDDSGVWDRHLQIECADDAFTLVTGPEAVATVNGEPSGAEPVREGDILELGSVKLRFGFSPMQQTGLHFRETLTWLALAIVCLSQVAIIYLLAS